MLDAGKGSVHGLASKSDLSHWLLQCTSGAQQTIGHAVADSTGAMPWQSLVQMMQQMRSFEAYDSLYWGSPLNDLLNTGLACHSLLAHRIIQVKQTLLAGLSHALLPFLILLFNLQPVSK